MKVAKLIWIFAAGVLFGSGLAISGMTDPARVIGFLDGTGMLILRRLGGRSLKLPSAHSSPISRSLVIGATIFGVGWGLGGFCPGPALANLGAFRTEALVFVPMMVIGMLIAQRAFGADR